MEEMTKDDALSYKMAQNEMAFKKVNQKVTDGLSALEKLAKKEGQEDLLIPKESTFDFICECADENCKERITISAEDYEKLHKNRRQFITLPDHNVPQIEKVVRKTNDYIVVEKTIEVPAKKDAKLNKTPVDNS